MTLSASVWIALHRMRNRWYDVLAVGAGYCNDRPNKTGVPGHGYFHWRCALKRRHDGMHREGNYVWSDDGESSYLPAPYGSGREAWQPSRWDRTGNVPTMRESRRRRRSERSTGASR